jgi:dolichol-phosphate mannosyltransferase
VAKMRAVAARLSRIICKAELADPMSGFFMLPREILEGALRRLSGQGFKLLRYPGVIAAAAACSAAISMRPATVRIGIRYRGNGMIVAA